MENNLKPTALFSEIKQLIEQSKNNLAVTVNAEMSMVYWNIGNRINKTVLQNERAEYGKQIVVSLARQLQQDFGSGWSEK